MRRKICLTMNDRILRELRIRAKNRKRPISRIVEEAVTAAV